MAKIDEGFLLKLGMKELLLAKLSNEQKKYLVAYAMDHHENPELSRSLVLLASMEASGKVGAAFLASERLATISQLKVLDKLSIVQLVQDYIQHQDPNITIKMIKDLIINEQQEKLYTKTKGAKGESYVITGNPF